MKSEDKIGTAIVILMILAVSVAIIVMALFGGHR